MFLRHDRGGWAVSQNIASVATPKYESYTSAITDWTANPSGGSSTDPLPPVSTITGVTLTGPTTSGAGGSTIQLAAFAAYGTNNPLTSVTLSISYGSVSPTGLATLPQAATMAQTVTVTAVSTQDPTKSATLSLSVSASATAGPLVLDPSFEQVSVAGSPNGFSNSPTGSPWTFTGNAGVATNSSTYAS